MFLRAVYAVIMTAESAKKLKTKLYNIFKNLQWNCKPEPRSVNGTMFWFLDPFKKPISMTDQARSLEVVVE